MFIKKVCRIGIGIFGIFGGYCGLCCLATLGKAMKQPHLVAATAQYTFLGYEMMATGYGIGCFCSVCAIIWLILQLKKHKNEE